jgi:choline dehydrogenase-like flavoprotein
VSLLSTDTCFSSFERALIKTIMAGFVGADPTAEAQELELASERLNDFLCALPDPSTAAPLRRLIRALALYATLRFRCRLDRLDDAQRNTLLRELCEPERTLLGRALERVNGRYDKPWPKLRDIARAVREMMLVAYYSTPGRDALSGYVPVWLRPSILELAPETTAPPARLAVPEIQAKHREGCSTPIHELFARSGRPRVAVIGSGAGGAVVASLLAASCDVAVFEAGPSFRPEEYPLDTLSGMALLYRDGLMSFSKNLDLQLIAGRLVGGSTVLTSGMSVRPRRRTLEAWRRVGIPLGAMHTGLETVEKRLRLQPLAEDLLTDVGRLWRGKNPQQQSELLFEVPRSNAAMTPAQHDPPGPLDGARRGERCLACGLCNYGCRFGHKLSVDQTFLKDARSAGARVHPNLGVHSLSARRDPRSGEIRVDGIVLERDATAPPIAVDYVVLAAGALGSAPLLLRSIHEDAVLSRLACRERVGKNLGFNYGTGVIAEWAQAPSKPGDAGIQIHYIASKPSDESFVLENAFLPPALLASLLPGIGPSHREWMQRYHRLGMAVNTIGSPQRGSIDRLGRVEYAICEHELGVIHESLALLVRSYLASGATRVGLSGVRALDDSGAIFYAGEESSSRAVLDKVRRVAATPDRLMMSSAHPQGGLTIDPDPERGAVSPEFNVHGVANLMVADASLFPSTIVVNPQWTVMALAHAAGTEILRRIERERDDRTRAPSSRDAQPLVARSA